MTPFCSCSAVPLFIGFVEAGIPLGVTFAFLISSPMVNEVALVLLGASSDPASRSSTWPRGSPWRSSAGSSSASSDGALVEDYVWALQGKGGTTEIKLAWTDQIHDAWAYTRTSSADPPYLLIGIGIGALIHGYAPTELVAAIGGRSNPLAVPIVVLIALPLYSNAAGTIPIVQALLGKGMPLGTTLAFMMAITAISLPEFIILRRVIRWPLIAAFATVVTIGILVIGYLFNALIP